MNSGMLVTPAIVIGIIVYVSVEYLLGHRRAIILSFLLLLLDALHRLKYPPLITDEPYVTIIFFMAITLLLMVNLNEFATGIERFYISMLIPLIMIYLVEQTLGVLMVVVVSAIYAFRLFKSLFALSKNMGLGSIFISLAIIATCLIFNEPQNIVVIAFETPLYSIAVRESGWRIRFRSVRLDEFSFRLSDVDKIYQFVSKIEKKTGIRIPVLVIDNKVFFFEGLTLYELTASDMKLLRSIMERPIKPLTR